MAHSFLTIENVQLIIHADDKAVDIIEISEPHCLVNDNPNAVTEQCKRELIEYFNGKREHFDVKIAPVGTPFQLKVWEALQATPFGETDSYIGVAKKIATPKHARAVGGALNRNPILIIIPCHRIIGSNGSMTGFAAGISFKKLLLNLEKQK